MILKRKNVEMIVNDEHEAEVLKKEGFVVIGEPETTSDGNTDHTEKALDEMTVAELHAVAKVKGLAGHSSLNKEELIAALKGA